MTIDWPGVFADAWGRWKRDRPLLLPLAGLFLFLPQFAFYLLAAPFPRLTPEQARDTEALLAPGSPLVVWMTHNAPGMLATVELGSTDARAWPLVPTEALIDSGDGTRVILERDGAFVPVAVTPGRSAGGLTEIHAGLGGGETVVASGQFLIDSEANLNGALRNLAPPKAVAP